MQAHIEKEYKMMLNKEDYEYFLNDLSLTSIKQINYYYQTSTPNHAIRIREVDKHFYFTLKIKENDYHKEYEFEIKENNINDPSISELLKQFNINDLTYLGYMINYRASIKMNCGELCLDKSIYLNKEDYEIEFELFDYQKDEPKEFFDLLSKRNLNYIRSANSKFKRYLIELNKNKSST